MPPSDQPLTGYAQALQDQDKYPLRPRLPWKARKQDRKHPVATPFLVIPNSPGDQGALRPLDAPHAKQSVAIEIVDAKTHVAVVTPVVGKTYALRCQAQNLGAAGCYAGIAEFYVATPAALDALAVGAGRRPAPLGFGGFAIPAGGHTTVTCQRQWKVPDLNRGILVRIYDPIMDRPPLPYNSAADRHIARRDVIPDFSGTYAGMERFLQAPTIGSQIKIVIRQVNNVADIAIYEEVSWLDTSGATGRLHTDLTTLDTARPISSGFPATPQTSASATVAGAGFTLDFTAQLSAQPFTRNVWTFSLTNPNLLHFTKHCSYLMPGDGRPDQDLTGDLPRQ